MNGVERNPRPRTTRVWNKAHETKPSDCIPDSTVFTPEDEKPAQVPPPDFIAQLNRLFESMEETRAAIVERIREEYRLRGYPEPL